VLEKLQKQAMDIIVQGDHSIVKCLCGNVMEVEEGKVDYNQKDDNGKIINRGASEHMSKYRVRCGACKNNFCTRCNEQPYHTGKTCEELKAFNEATKCRFCNEVIEDNKDAGAFKDVCQKDECRNMIGQSCDKIHQCGHPCKGFKNEIY